MEEVDGADTKQYRWDAKGRLAEERLNGSATPFQSYEWSVDDRLLAVVLHAEATGQNAPPRITYGYDHAGTRVARSALPASVDGEAMPPALRRAQAYLTDYNNPTGYAQSLQEIDPEERDLAVAITTKRAFDESGLLEEQGAAGYAAFHGDNLGSVRGLTDATGSVSPAAVILQ